MKDIAQWYTVIAVSIVAVGSIVYFAETLAL